MSYCQSAPSILDLNLCCSSAVLLICIGSLLNSLAVLILYLHWSCSITIMLQLIWMMLLWRCPVCLVCCCCPAEAPLLQIGQSEYWYFGSWMLLKCRSCFGTLLCCCNGAGGDETLLFGAVFCRSAAMELNLDLLLKFGSCLHMLLFLDKLWLFTFAAVCLELKIAELPVCFATARAGCCYPRMILWNDELEFGLCIEAADMLRPPT